MTDKLGEGGIGALLGALTGGRGGVDGLGELVGRLRQGGLQEEVDSWIGPGANRDVSPDRLAGALGQDEMAGLAQRLGLGGGQGAGGGRAMAGILAVLLPQLINGLTPQGRMPQSDAEYGSGGMGGLLSQMMGGAGQAPAGGGGGIAGMLGALMGGGGAGPADEPDSPAPSGKPGMGGAGPLDKSNLGAGSGGPLPQKPRPLR